MTDLKDKEIELGGRKIGANTPISMNLWTFVALIGIILGIFLYFYNDLKGDVSSVKTEFKKFKDDYTNDVKIIFETKGQVDNIKNNVDIMVRRELNNPNHSR